MRYIRFSRLFHDRRLATIEAVYQRVYVGERPPALTFPLLKAILYVQIIIIMAGHCCIIRQVYIDTLHLSGIEGQQGVEGFKVIAIDYDVSGVRGAVIICFFFCHQAVFGVGRGFEVLFPSEPTANRHSEFCPWDILFTSFFV